MIKYSDYEYFDLKDSSQQNIKYSEYEFFSHTGNTPLPYKSS